MAHRQPKVKVIPEYTRFQGGLDLESPALTIDPGALLFAMNYMCGTEGGYSRLDGYEGFDGQASPSDATYYTCPCSFTGGGPSLLDTVTGADSGETGYVITIGTDYINVTKLSGDFNDDEVYTVGGVAKGTFTAAQNQKGESTALLHVTALNLAADAYRLDIAAPTGSGAIRGIAMLAGTVYSFRDNAGGTAGLIYKSSAAGWVAVTPGSELSFDTGVAEISDGDTITQLVTGATATVSRIVHETGTWAANSAAGRLILSGITGTFNAVNDLQVGGATKATSTSLAVAIAILPGGRYETVVYNFTGSTATQRIYGCDGVNRGFEFDGTVYVPLDTKMTTDTPTHVAAYKKQLFFSFRGSSQNSGIGTPYVWSAVLGADEIAIGDDITGYMALAKALIIYSRNSTHQLIGSDDTDFVLDIVDDSTGGIAHTIQDIITSHCLDDSGIVEISKTLSYGNFNLGTVSRKIQKKIDDMRKVVVASAAYRARNQYRLYGTDGTGLCMTITQARRGTSYAFTQFSYPDNVACTATGEDSTGKDVVYLGSDAGMVYQADMGSSFDGEDIEAYVWLPFNSSKSPTTLKTYRRGIIEMTAEAYTSLRFNVEFSYGDPNIQAHIVDNLEVLGSGGLWDVAEWDEFYWDSQIIANPSFPIDGDGINTSLVIYGKSQIDLGHKLDGATIHYTPRRLVR